MTSSRAQAALSAKGVLGIASGMLAATVRFTPAEGGQRLRTYAAIHRQRPAGVAEDLVRRRLTPLTVLIPAP
ncbi:ANTAR domain-containing protein [Streptomyces sp. NPDC088707]|uniref:ANTAR domain-containing protein n=1 Tax=Streptomyces sp. NPDC088707 TaxID=3365871 RepID=UPI00381BA377